MSHSTRIRWALGGVAIGLLLALMLLPSTGWIARQQVAYQLFPWAGGDDLSELLLGGPPRFQLPGTVARREAAIRRAAKARPDDLGMQMAMAFRQVEPAQGSEGNVSEVEALQRLLPRFGDRPALYATLVRTLSFEDGLKRPEELLLEGGRPSPGGFTPPAGQARKVWEAMREYASAGERLEPDNAYFSTMAAVAAVALREDAAALAALSRAAAGSRWHDYAEVEPIGKLALRRTALGPQPAATELAISAAVMLPHYAWTRSMARTLTYLALKDEQAGQAAQGLKVRLELLRLGSLMRAEPTSIIGPLVGISVEQCAIQRPGGSPKLPEPANADAETMMRQRNALFVRYAREHAPPRQAAWAQAELDTSAAVRRTIRQATQTDYFVGPALKVAFLRGLGWALLFASFWIGVMACGNWLGRAARPGDETPAFSRYFPWTVAFVHAALALALAYAADRDMPPKVLIFAMVAVAVAGALAAAGTALKHGWPESRGRLGALALAAAVTAALAIWQLPSPLMSRQPKVISVLTSACDGGGDADVQFILAALLPLVVPIVLLFALGLAAALRREGAAVGAIRLFGLTAMPVIAALLVCYGASVVATARAEKHASTALAGVLSGEGKYASGLIGKPWPGPAPPLP